MFTDPRLAGAGAFVLGLVGRAGAGKSTVARALAADGARVIDADALGHEVTDHDPGVRAALAAEYGDDVYRADGSLDRGRVAARVFTDPAARARLDRLVHPRIIERAAEQISEWLRDGFRGVAVLDAALLLEWGLERWCDAVLAVVAPEALAIERLVASRHWTPQQARERREVQRSDAAFRAAADVTLDNDGTPERLAGAAREAVRTLRARREAAGKDTC